MRKRWLGMAAAGMMLFASGCGAENSTAAASNEMAQWYAVEETTEAAFMDEASVSLNQDLDSSNRTEGTVERDTADDGAAEVVETGRKLIQTASMDVETEQFEEMMTALEAQVKQVGGYIENENISGGQLDWQRNPMMRWADLTVQIPQERLDEFLNGVELSGNVVRRSKSIQDVTLQYSDIEDRKKTLKIEQERLWELLEKADSIDSIIALEERLSEIRYELESYESRLRLYDNQIEYSQVTLNISEVKKYTEPIPETTGERIKRGLISNGERLAEGLKDFGIGVIVTSPFWLTFGAVVAVAGLGICHIRKRKGKGVKKRIPDAAETQERRTSESEDPK